ncbi:hypothetical protein H6F98_01920 [Microcoleus sp. FACHB-SPT15]|nr:hypothetical protein [Microcoleus sp. FACHB-SPT15]MBD1804232.1 hypothetical protein [Microcoleus sp. FACHB-SPT15]
MAISSLSAIAKREEHPTEGVAISERLLLCLSIQMMTLTRGMMMWLGMIE